MISTDNICIHNPQQIKQLKIKVNPRKSHFYKRYLQGLGYLSISHMHLTGIGRLVHFKF